MFKAGRTESGLSERFEDRIVVSEEVEGAVIEILEGISLNFKSNLTAGTTKFKRPYV